MVAGPLRVGAARAAEDVRERAVAAAGRRGCVEGLVGGAFHPVVAGEAVQPVGVVGGEPALFAVEAPRLFGRHLVEGDVVSESRCDGGDLFAFGERVGTDDGVDASAAAGVEQVGDDDVGAVPLVDRGAGLFGVGLDHPSAGPDGRPPDEQGVGGELAGPDDRAVEPGRLHRTLDRQVVFGFDANPNIDAAMIHTLAKCEWIKKGLPLCLIGDSGTGKSHLLIALGTEAAMAGYRVKYVLATKLVNELVEAADEKQLTKTIARYGRVDLLCIDELGYLELDRRGAELLFQVLTEREKNSVAIASNESFSGRTKTFTDPRLCAAIVDRLTFGGNIIETGTDSYRLATTRARAEQQAAG